MKRQQSPEDLAQWSWLHYISSLKMIFESPCPGECRHVQRVCSPCIFSLIFLWMNNRGGGGWRGLFPKSGPFKGVMAECAFRLVSSIRQCVSPLRGINQERLRMFGFPLEDGPGPLSQNTCEWLWQMGPSTGAGGGWWKTVMSRFGGRA